ncbi:MAG: glycosyltransferase [Acidobacteriota bacterium]|nr:glycosyltransferase [Acidobacteriota bacterium]
MKILLVNKFFYRKGGSETLFFDTAELLRRHGHEVRFFSMSHPRNETHPDSRYFMSPIDFDRLKGPSAKLKAAGRILYSLEARRKIEALIRRARPDVAHLHNIHRQISPSILHGLRRYGIPTVMTLHDYQLVCPAYILLSGGQPCDRCRGGRYYHGVLRRCLKNSAAAGFLGAAEAVFHRTVLGIFRNVDLFISPSLFLIQQFRSMGFRGRIRHLPNLFDPGPPPESSIPAEKTLVFAGRLSTEKGVGLLLEAVRNVEVTVKILGDGPERTALERTARTLGLTNVAFLGHQPRERVWEEIRRSLAIVVPSIWPENSPYAVVEAFALGKPVIGAFVGGIPEFVRNGETGRLFKSGSAFDLQRSILSFLENPERIPVMGKNARKFSEEHFHPNRHYDGLITAYRSAAENRR